MTNNEMAAFVTMTEAAVCWYARHEHCVIPNSRFLIFQTSKRYDFDSVWARVSHTATCHDNH